MKYFEIKYGKSSIEPAELLGSRARPVYGEPVAHWVGGGGGAREASQLWNGTG